MHQGRWKTFSLLIALFPGAAFASAEFPSPALEDHSLELRNTATITAYNPAHRQADWVFYPLGDAELRNCVNRGSNFRPDSRLPREFSSQLSDYAGSGFDRGHLSPAGDNKWSSSAMSESFLLSNISPQLPSFNSGIWGRLEGMVRAWARDLGGLWVATGPLLRDGLPTIGSSRVSVPEYFFKVLSTKNRDRHSAVAFLLPKNASGDLSRYSMTVNQLEEITGMDFLAGLEDEEVVEMHVDPLDWNLKSRFTYLPCQAIAPGSLDWAWGLSL